MTRKILKSILAIMLFVPGLCFAKEVHYMTEEYPPYNFAEGNEITGISIDILAEMREKMNMEPPKVSLFPWVRGYRFAQMPNKHNVIFSTTRTEDRIPKFKWVGPIAKTEVSVFCNKNVKAEISNDEDLSKYTYAVIRDDIGQLELTSRNVPKSSVQDVTKFDVMVNLVKTGRKNCFAYEGNVASYLMQKSGVNANDFERKYVLIQGELYYAFNKSVSDSDIETHQKALDEVRADKDLLDSIYSKYGVND